MDEMVKGWIDAIATNLKDLPRRVAESHKEIVYWNERDKELAAVAKEAVKVHYGDIYEMADGTFLYQWAGGFIRPIPKSYYRAFGLE